MSIIRSAAVAFSLYSRIPMPHFDWNEEDMKYNLVFLPWVGGVIGLLMAGLCLLSGIFYVPVIARCALVALIPVIVTGGFHLDGFLDVEDALRSYKPKEEKLAILKDPHIGAFAVICLLRLILIWAASLAIILSADSGRYVFAFAASFFTLRCLAALTSILLPRAKQDGMLHMETEKADRGVVTALAVECALGALVMVWAGGMSGVTALMGAALFTLRFRSLCTKEFGGVTGDTAGFYIVKGETVVLALLAAYSLIGAML